MRWRLVVVLVALAGCSNLYEYRDGSYVVRAGDTLYSIAFAHGIDQRDLAAWNGIGNPDRIYVGQRLTLVPSASGAAAVRTQPARAGSSPPANRAPTRPTSATAASPPPAWRWPAAGTVVGQFGDRRVLATGIGIAGRLGQAVNASAAGRVVYAGGGLPDYGQLVIIEHSSNWLTAYGYNRRVIVSQGDSVSAGDKIAEMGTGPGGVAMVHFEIRRNGDPLDPLQFLPPSR